MSESDFEKIVANDKYLNILINEHKFGVMANIKKSPAMTDEFIDWLSPKYYEAFEAIYKNNIDEKPAIIGTVLRMNFLANEATKEKLAQFFLPKLDDAILDAESLKTLVANKKFDSKIAVKHLERISGPLNQAVFKHLKHPLIAEKKKVLGEKLLEASDLLSGVSVDRNTEAFGVYTLITAAAEQLNVGGAQQQRIVQHEQNQNSKMIWSTIIGLIIFILLMLRFFLW